MATVTLNINGISEGWTGASGTATDIDEPVASADGSEYGGGAEADAATFDLSAHGLSDSDVISNVSITVRMRDAGTAGTLTCDVDFLIGGSPQGTTQSTGALTSSHADYGPLNDTGWNSDWTASQLDGAQVRLTPQQSGMPGTNDAFVDCVDVVITYSSAITADAAATSPQPTADASVESDDFCLYFDGVSDSVSAGDVHDFAGTAPFTVEVWMIPDATQPGGSFVRLVSKEDTDDTGWDLTLAVASNAVLLARQDSLGTDSAQQSYTDDVEQHVAGVYDGSDLQVFVDGSGGSTSASSRSLPGNTQNLTFGKPSPFGSNEYAGVIREIRIWDHARTSTQINAFKDKRLTGQEDGLVGYWRIDEGSGATVTDDADNNDGTITNAIWVARPSPVSDYTAAAQATAPLHSAEAVVNVADASITANTAATAPAHSASAVAENPVSADAAATAPQAAASAVVANPVTADVAATAPLHSAAAVATIGETITAEAAATAPAHSANVTANVLVEADAAATAPAHSASAVADAIQVANAAATARLHSANVVADVSIEAIVGAVIAQPTASAVVDSGGAPASGTHLNARHMLVNVSRGGM